MRGCLACINTHVRALIRVAWDGGRGDNAGHPFNLFADYLPELSRNYSVFFRLPHCPMAWQTISHGD